MGFKQEGEGGRGGFEQEKGRVEGISFFHIKLFFFRIEPSTKKTE